MAVTPPSVQQLAEQLSTGFVALSGEYQLLFDQHRQLESKLSWAKQQYLDLLKRFTPSTLSQDHLVFLSDLERAACEPQKPQTHWSDQIAHSDDSERRNRAAIIKQAEVAATRLHVPAEDNGVKIWSGPSADKEKPALPTQGQRDRAHLEKDFTTAGTPSKLGCPFASGSARQSPLATPRTSSSRLSPHGRRSKRLSFTDPIRADICGNDAISASASASIEGSAAVCPIRFLDQHSPADVAKYFEKHKHELPRSHEVCISRFQSNAQSIEQLDRKYGDLVSMIQGLGEKHQPWLPEEPDEAVEDEPGNESKKVVKVENWAKEVTASLQNMTPEEEEAPGQGVEDNRTTHFDRPLKEVRVGESPSRPWGISIPAKYTNAESSSSVGSAPTASPPIPLKTDRPINETPPKVGKCPFDHQAFAKTPETKLPQQVSEAPPQPESEAFQPSPERQTARPVNPESAESKGADHESPKVIPQMVFNGPVFLGYPPDQLMTLLQNSNLGASMR